MGCDVGPTLNRDLGGGGWAYEVHGRDTVSPIHWQVLNGCWPAPGMVVGGIQAEDKF